jgi:hypothetical protein
VSKGGERNLMGITQGAFDPASRVRFIQFVPLFESAGWRVSHRPNRPDRQWRSKLGNRIARGVHYRAGRTMMRVNRVRDVMDARDFDAIFLNRDLIASDVRYERMLLSRNRRVIFDFDDAIFLGGAKGERHARWMSANAAWVTPGNAYLAEWARQWTDRITIVPTVIDTDRYERKEWNGADFSRPMRVGWTGSDVSIVTTLFPHLEMLARSQKELGFELVVISNTKPTLPVSGINWTFHPWRPEEEGALGRMFDVGIMPLVDNTFQRGKCGFKLLQCMAAGLPTIGSPVGVNAEIVQEGRTGFLATTPDEWHEALRVLTNTPELRVEMGRAGWERCEQEYSLNRWFPELLAIVNRVAS